MLKLLHIDDNLNALVEFKNKFGTNFKIISEPHVFRVDEHLESTKFDGFVVDIYMPYMDGASVLKKVRSCRRNNSAAFFVLSGDEKLETRLDFLKDGISDFLVKSMDDQEIFERISMGLKKRDSINKLSLGNLELDTYHLSVKVDNVELSLTLIEYKILLCLLRKQENILSREILTDFVWNELHVEKNVLNTHLYNLKSKLKAWDFKISSIRFKGLSLKKK